MSLNVPMNEIDGLNDTPSFCFAVLTALLISEHTSSDVQPGYVIIILGLYSENSALSPEGPVSPRNLIASEAFMLFSS